MDDFEDVWRCASCNLCNRFEDNHCIQCNHPNNTVWKCISCGLLNMVGDNHCFQCNHPRAVWNNIVRTLCARRILHAIPRDEETECLICNNEVEVGDRVGWMGCTHLYHHRCLQEWMNRGTFTCPTCRGPVPMRRVEVVVPVLEADL